MRLGQSDTCIELGADIDGFPKIPFGQTGSRRQGAQQKTGIFL
jgi:hypothetical protein